MLNFFRKKSKVQIDPHTAIDWLGNMTEALTERMKTRYFAPTSTEGHPPQFISQSDSNQLATFAVMESLVSTEDILRIFPPSVSVLGPILFELTLYFESIWQLYLLNKFPGSQDKVSKLAAIVDINEKQLWEAFFINNLRIKAVLGEVVENRTYKKVLEATAIYISGRRSNEQEQFVNQIRDVLKNNPNFRDDILRLTSTAIFQLRTVLKKDIRRFQEEESVKLIMQMYDNTASAFKNKLLVEFNLDKCEVPEFPPEFYQKP